MPSERHHRQRYSEELKVRFAAVCHGTGVSVAVVALEHRLNAKLLRRWIDQAEVRLPKGLPAVRRFAAASSPAGPRKRPATLARCCRLMAAETGQHLTPLTKTGWLVAYTFFTF
ncbi:transposase [Paraburkholderia steynii]|uniref:transposase n=1 Tax=Paraburkholderia steynii TaxID=1245441 RepID=UPI000B83D133|nr:transposase [Paraburkholderia steynii]